MNLSGRNLSFGMRGDDVALLQSELSALGYIVSGDELGSRSFGSDTRAAVLAFQGKSGVARTGVVDPETARLINDRYDALSPTAPPSSFTVKGRVFDAAGNPLPGVLVLAYDRDLRNEEALGPGPATTDSSGAYSITYTPDQFAHAEEGTADVLVRAFAQAPGGGTGAQLAQSDVYFDVGDTVEINLTVPPPATSSGPAVGLSEYERVAAEIAPLLVGQGASGADLAATDLTVADVEFIAGETSMPAVRIAFYVAAQKNAQASGVSSGLFATMAAAFYGMAREGLPTALNRLLAQSRAACERALDDAIADNIIPASVGQSISTILDTLAGLAAAQTVAPSTAAGRSTIGDHLTAGGVAPALQQPFVSAWLGWTGTVPDFWTNLATQNGFNAQAVQQIQLSLQLGAITQHAKVVQALVGANPPVTTARQLVSWDASHWSTFIRGLADAGGNLPIPSDIQGATTDEKVANYAATLVHVVQSAFPAAAYVEPLRSIQNPPTDLINFVDANASFDLARSPIDAYLQTAASVPTDPTRKAALVDSLKKTQRLYRLTPSMDELRAIEQANLHSAAAITRGGRANFVAQFSNAFGADRANAIYDRAEHAAGVALQLFARFSPSANSLGLPSLPTPAETTGGGHGMFAAEIATPDYASLFGSLDLCDCAECKSVLGPAAYLVDLLHFLSRYPVPNSNDTALDKLTKVRRPDLLTTDLSCDNTNVELPYIDLANEVMEAAIAGASVRNTTQPADVLAVEPQYEDLRAYDAVARDVYPWSLPFDLGAARARGFLGQLDVRRDELMETFQNQTGASAPAVDGETLGMTPFEVRLATGGLTLGPKVAAATTGPIALSGAPVTIDGVSVDIGQLVLAKDQADTTKNGIYMVAEVGWQRAMNLAMQTGLVVPIANGTANGKKAFVETARFPVRTGIDPIAFAALPAVAPGEYTFVNAKAATTANIISLQNLQTIDGVQLQANDVVLVKNQTNATENGLYTAQDNAAWTRAVDPLPLNLAVSVQQGSQAGNRFALTTAPSYLPDTTALTFLPATDDATDALFTPYWRFWGYGGNQAPVTFVADLSTVATLLAKSGMSYDDLGVLLGTSYVNPGGLLTIKFAGTSCDLSQATIVNKNDVNATPAVTPSVARRIHRFERLRRKLGWTAVELDRALTVLAQPEITGAFVGLAAEIERLRRRFILSVEEVLAFFAPFAASTATASSLYDQTYLNPRTQAPIDPAFSRTPDGTALVAQNETIAGHRVGIMAALALSSQDFALLTSGDAVAPAEVTGGQQPPLSLENLWRLYRATSFARSLGFSVRDYLHLKALAGIDPLQLGNTPDFVRAVDVFRAAGFGVDDLVYLLTPVGSLPSFAPSLTAAAVTLGAIRAGVVRIANANANPPDGGLDAARAVVTDQLTKLPLGPGEITTALSIFDLTTNLNDNDQTAFVQTNLSAFLDPADATLIGNNKEADVGKRFEYVRTRLATYVAGRAIVKERLADAFQLSPATVEEQLLRYQPYGRPAIALFFDPTWLATAGTVDPNQSPRPFVGFYWLHKVSLVAARLGLGETDLHVVADLLGKPGLASLWIDFTKLPVDPNVQHGAPSDLIIGLYELARFVAVRKSIPKRDTRLDQVFYDTVTANNVSSVLGTLAAATGWAQSDVNALAARLGLAAPTDLQAVDPIVRLAACADALRHLGVPADEAIAHFVGDAVTIDDAAAAKRAAKAKYDAASWPAVAKPIQDGLRERKRAALVAHHVGGGDFPDDKALFDALLIDVDMTSCMMTSRIKQAISTTQLFIQRELLNLEPDVALDAEARREWTWMRAYRLWEANRQVFLYPENWIDPSLRDDKSAFFKELETELSQQPLTDAVAEDAYAHYLAKLDEVARMQVTGFYREANGVMHVFGRTRGVPPKHIYRQLVNGRWTPWELVKLDIEADRVMPIVYNRRLHLFWTVFEQKQNPDAITLPDSQSKLDVENHSKPAQPHFEIKLAWSEHHNGAWTPKRVSEKVLSTIDIASLPDSGDATSYVCKALTDGNDVVVRVILPETVFLDDKGNLSGEVGTKTDVTWVGEFRFSGALTDVPNVRPGGEVAPTPIAFALNTGYDLIAPDGTTVNGNAFIEKWPSQPDSQGLTLFDYQFLDRLITPPIDHTIADAVDRISVTTKTPVDSGHQPLPFSVIPPHNQLEFVAEECFYQDALRTFYIEPTDPPPPPPNMWSTMNNTPPDIGDNVRGNFYVPPAPKQPDPGLLVDGGAFVVNPPRGYKTLGGVQAQNQPQTIQMILGGNPPLNDQHGILKFSPDQIYRLDSFYHPYSSEFIGKVNRDGVDGLLSRDVQILPEPYLHSPYQHFLNDYGRGPGLAEPYPKEDVDFDPAGAYSSYNREIFFHIPFTIATRLMADQQFEAARKWFHYIFDPTDPTGGTDASRFWKFQPFVQEAKGEPIQDLLALLGDDGTDPNLAAMQKSLEADVAAWRADPFNPFLIARLRPSAWAKAVVMKYIDNLIAWGDQLFRQDTIESINEATQLYILAAELLGPRPLEVARDDLTGVKTYADLAAHLDDFGNSLVGLENGIKINDNGGGKDLPPGIGNALYFCVPRNNQLLAYWDTVDDRLFKIRHCMNIEGVVQRLPLFEPPIDPALLVRAQAAGVDLASALSDVTAHVPFYRFQTMLQRAIDFAGEVRGLGGALLSVLEKRDGEALALLRSSQEQALLAAVRDVKQRAVDEANAQIDALNASKAVVQARYDYYSTIPQYIPAELNQSSQLQESKTDHENAFTGHLAAGIARAIPDFVTGISGLAASPVSTLKIGGSMFGAIADIVAVGYVDSAQITGTSAQMSGVQAQYARRTAEWAMQANVAKKELDQLDKQLAAAEVRLAIAEKDLANQDLQIANAKAVDDFLRDKFTAQTLYDWMVSEVSALYFQAYQLAYDVAKRAERAFRFERPEVTTTYINFGYWDSLKKGLLAGERLQLDLRRMEIAYLEANRRELEITKHISLADFAPDALINLRELGTCTVTLPEALFDADYPGHYMRRVKSVSVTVPCTTGSYTGVNARLSLGSNQIRTSTKISGNYPTLDNTNSIQNLGGVESIATSSAQADAGMFELNFRDERFLPFEGAGVINSTWTLTMPRERNFFDMNSITDVVFHVRYTARDGGDAFGGLAAGALPAAPSLSCFLSAKEDFEDAWEEFWDAAADAPGQTFTFTLDQDDFRAPPFKRVNSHLVAKITKVKKVSFIWKWKDRPLPNQSISAAGEYDLKGTALQLTIPGPDLSPATAALSETSPDAVRFAGLPTLASTFNQQQGLPLTLTVSAPEDNNNIKNLDRNDIPLAVPPDGNAPHYRLNRDAVEDLIIVVDYTEV